MICELYSLKHKTQLLSNSVKMIKFALENRIRRYLGIRTCHIKGKN